jgi:hypothetical protein
MVLLYPPAVGAQLFSLVIETRGGYLSTTETPFFENEIIIEEEIGWYKGVVVRVENELAGEVEEEVMLEDELKLEGRARLFEWVWAGPSLIFTFDESRSRFAAEAVVVLAGTIGLSGMELWDENKLRYNVSDEDLLYVNELDVVQPFALTPRTILYIAVENDLLVGEETENELEMGPGISIGPISLFATYLMVAGEGAVVHGVKGGVAVVL